MKYTRAYECVCPKDQERTVHCAEYAKATCTRVPDTLLHFQCRKDGNCKECEEEYRE